MCSFPYGVCSSGLSPAMLTGTVRTGRSMQGEEMARGCHENWAPWLLTRLWQGEIRGIHRV